MNDMGKQEHKEKKAAVILAAGSGRRMNTPVAKQFLDLMGIPVFLHSVRLFDKMCIRDRASLVEEIIPPEAVWITIEKDLDKGFDYRKITVRGK